MTEHKTLISHLNVEKDQMSLLIDVDNEDIETINDYILDGSVSVENRLQTLQKFYEKYGEDQCIEIVNRIAGLYQFSGIKILEKYLYKMCADCKISPFLKLTAAKSLCYFDTKKEIGYNALDFVCQDMKGLATPCQIEAVCLLMIHKTYKKKSRDYFCNIINDHNLECDYRYKTILSLENKDISNRSYFLHESAREFFDNSKNRTLYRILAGQYLIQKCKIKEKDLESVELVLMTFAQDPELDYNLRADSADVILRLGSPDNKKTAREIIMMLGRQDGTVKTIFDNAQNVHVDEIEESVLEAVRFLSGIEMKTLSGTPGTPQITFEYVKKQIDDMLEKEKPKEPKECKEVAEAKEKKRRISKKKLEIAKKYESLKQVYEEKEDKMNVSLNRIYMDRALYSNFNCTLLHILLKVWTYMTSHESEETMRKRLMEELVEMSGTCSTGFAGRLVNVISGFGDFNLRISWRDQITANFTGRLNARARDIANEEKLMVNGNLYNIVAMCCDNELKDDESHRRKLHDLLEKFQGNVLEEMTINSNDYASRTNFLLFFRKNMLTIRQELYEEFKDHIDDSSFDLYFRAAIATYETGGYV
jgi:hypothetical protein